MASREKFEFGAEGPTIDENLVDLVLKIVLQHVQRHHKISRESVQSIEHDNVVFVVTPNLGRTAIEIPKFAPMS